MMLGHAALVVNDLDQSIEFYSWLLGAVVTRFDPVPELHLLTRGAFLSFGAKHHDLAFFEAPPGQDHRPLEFDDRPGLHHLAFEVDSREELDRLCALLKARGVRILWGPGIQGTAPGGDGFKFGSDSCAIFFRDPDGNRLELCHGGMTLAKFQAKLAAEEKLFS